MKITADFTKITGRIKPMHAVGQPPYSAPGNHYLHYLTEAGIPYSRLHDMGGAYGGNLYVDIPNIFRDFSADENDPASYDFAFTDDLITEMVKAGVEPFFRLGVTIENYIHVKKYRIFPPADYGKWARVCEHIVRHYNEGWADGYRYGITYWEIWNEPDNDFFGDDNMMWDGTQEDYYRLYEVTANHLKSCFGDSIKVGGYASSGLYALESDPTCKGLDHPVASRAESFIDFFHGFLAWITSKEHHAPIDFFSWHSYDSVPRTMQMEDYCRKVLANYGLGDLPDMMNEWNPCADGRRFTNVGAAATLAMMLGMQKKPISMLMFYDARMRTSAYEGLFNSETKQPTPVYFAFMMFGHLYRLGDEIETAAEGENLYVGGATKNGKKILLIVNQNGEAVDIDLAVKGADPADAEIFSIDETYTCAPNGHRVVDGKLTLPAFSCTEIRF